MKIITIYKITHEPTCLRVFLSESTLTKLDNPGSGRRMSLGLKEPVLAQFSTPENIDAKQFYFLNDSFLVVPAEMMNTHPDVFWLVESGSDNLVIDVNGDLLKVINFLDTLPPDPSYGAPCRVDKHYCPLFRIEKDPLGIYCSTGHLEPRNEFVGAYQYLGLKGLNFDPIWSGEV